MKMPHGSMYMLSALSTALRNHPRIACFSCSAAGADSGAVVASFVMCCSVGSAAATSCWLHKRPCALCCCRRMQRRSEDRKRHGQRQLLKQLLKRRQQHRLSARGRQRPPRLLQRQRRQRTTTSCDALTAPSVWRSFHRNGMHGGGRIACALGAACAGSQRKSS